jgi:hypothetical protein
MIADGKKQAGDQVKIEKEDWDGDTLHFAVEAQGQNLSGSLAIKETEFVVDLKLPFYLKPFEGRIQKAILEQSQALLKGGTQS